MDEHDRSSLKELIMTMLAERDRQYQQRFDAMERASIDNKSYTNEFRGQLRDQAITFMPRSEVVVIVDRLTDRIEELTKKVDQTAGQKEGGANVWTMLAIIGSLITAAVAVIAGFFKHPG